MARMELGRDRTPRIHRAPDQLSKTNSAHTSTTAEPLLLCATTVSCFLTNFLIRTMEISSLMEGLNSPTVSRQEAEHLNGTTTLKVVGMDKSTETYLTLRINTHANGNSQQRFTKRFR